MSWIKFSMLGRDIMFEIEKKSFLKGLSLMQGITGRRAILPILSNLYMEWGGDSLSITGTDLEIAIQERLEARVYKEGKASVPSRKLFEIVRELPEEIIQIQVKENHWINIQCGKSVFNLSGLNPDDFPSLPVPEEESFISLSILK